MDESLVVFEEKTLSLVLRQDRCSFNFDVKSIQSRVKFSLSFFVRSAVINSSAFQRKQKDLVEIRIGNINENL